jgi:hypothetical protein
MDQWLSAVHAAQESRAVVRARLGASPPAPCQLEQFLNDERARALRACFDEIRHWRRSACVLGSNDSFIEVSSDAWDDAPAELRRTRQDLARPLEALFAPGGLPDAARELLEEFIEFMVAGEFRDWLCDVADPAPRGDVSFEFARYHTGDFLAPHTDLHPGCRRILAINVYLGPWQPGDGGLLGFRDERGDAPVMAPVANSVSIIPIRAGAEHWVSPWMNAAPGRYTAAFGYDGEAVTA